MYQKVFERIILRLTYSKTKAFFVSCFNNLTFIIIVLI